ncbi:MAG: 4-hydroxy-3-methylbut-2-enyl diphosphate reductase [Desulfovibrio sp.]|nr:4-hydroxy-3-methylbut-2-enyl diphosphate reductase [Desulfovibrio sp.]
MDVVRAKTAGFCMGVSLALKKLDTALRSQHYKRIYTLGPLIHNPQVLEFYERKGVVLADTHTQFAQGDCVVIRAHGIPRQNEEHLRQSGVHVIDATCPKVKKAQLAIAKATAKGQTLLLFGEADHPEVRGLISYAVGASCVLGDPKALPDPTLVLSSGIVLASQTTQERAGFLALKTAMQEHYPHLQVLETICDATKERQDEVRGIAKKVDIMVVVGGRSSGNTRRLADVSSSCGVPTLLVETADELKEEAFQGKHCVGLTAGASTPKRLIDEAENFLLALT